MESTDKIRNFRDLLVWQKGMELVTETYLLTKQFPKEELFGMTSQIRRSAVSIPSNITEGFGRSTTTDYVRFLKMAGGSLYEMQTQLEISKNLNYLERSTTKQIENQTNEIGKMLNGLIKSLKAGL